MELFAPRRYIAHPRVHRTPSAIMASIQLNIDTETAWADLVEEAPAAAGASTPPPKENGWTAVKGEPKKKTKSRTKDTAPADAVAQKLNFGDKANLSKNPFAALADSDDE